MFAKLAGRREGACGLFIIICSHLNWASIYIWIYACFSFFKCKSQILSNVSGSFFFPLIFVAPSCGHSAFSICLWGVFQWTSGLCFWPVGILHHGQVVQCLSRSRRWCCGGKLASERVMTLQNNFWQDLVVLRSCHFAMSLFLLCCAGEKKKCELLSQFWMMWRRILFLSVD